MKKKEDILETIELLKTTSQFIGDARANLTAPYHLTHTQAVILLDVYHHPKETKITDICKRLNKTTNTISPLVKRLVEKGYLVKHQNAYDNRVFEVSFSDKGMNMMKHINEDVLVFSTPLFNELSDEEFSNLNKSLKILNKVCGLE
ncbi:MAG: winged helix DNA-binding protein [Roseburia sp.]|nr:winged helix DNA-binding protein [Anaeroplasma bactoclasticum]MCM1196884.1 winged helix DNA-binding protein [Roseburia sp.]